MVYQFEVIQKLKFEVYDMDNKTPDFCLGYMECTLAEVREQGKVHFSDLMNPVLEWYNSGPQYY